MNTTECFYNAHCLNSHRTVICATSMSPFIIVDSTAIWMRHSSLATSRRSIKIWWKSHMNHFRRQSPLWSQASVTAKSAMSFRSTCKRMDSAWWRAIADMAFIVFFTQHQMYRIMPVSPDIATKRSVSLMNLSILNYCRKQCGWCDEGGQCIHHWTDDIRGLMARWTMAGQLDCCHQRWSMVGTIWANTACYRNWLWNFDPTSFK